MFKQDHEKNRQKKFQQHLRDHERVEPDFAFWMEHVVHWHALLFALVVALSIGYVLTNQQPVLAG